MFPRFNFGKDLESVDISLTKKLQKVIIKQSINIFEKAGET